MRLRLLLLSLLISVSALEAIGAPLIRVPADSRRRLYACGGIGFPEFLHVSVGGFINARLSADLHYGIVIGNHMLGVGATYLWLGNSRMNLQHPRHSLLTSVQFRINPTLGELRLRSGGETLGAMAEIYAGYSYISRRGFMVRPMLGALLYSDGGEFAGGPNFKVAFGWAFWRRGHLTEI